MQLWNRRRGPIAQRRDRRRGPIAQSWELYFLFFLFRRIVKRELSTRRRGQRRLKWGLGLYSNSKWEEKNLMTYVSLQKYANYLEKYNIYWPTRMFIVPPLK